MKPCPHCGVMLTAALVDAIRNPSMDESCPSRPVEFERSVDEIAAMRIRLASFALLGAMFREAHS